MAEIGFSGPGAPDLKARGGGNPAKPEFFKTDRKLASKDNDSTSISAVESPREKAARVDAEAGTDGSAQGSAPKL